MYIKLLLFKIYMIKILVKEVVLEVKEIQELKI